MTNHVEPLSEEEIALWNGWIALGRRWLVEPEEWARVVATIAARDARIKELEFYAQDEKDLHAINFKLQAERDALTDDVRLMDMEITYLRAQATFNACPCTKHHVPAQKAEVEWLAALAPRQEPSDK